MNALTNTQRIGTMERTGPGSSYIPTLDGWRAIAILLVLTSHLGKSFSPENEYWSTNPTRFGAIGVPIFFGLSGFLITALLIDEFGSQGRISLESFYIRRCFRILPPLIVFLLVTSMLGLIASRLEMFSSLLFFRNYVPVGWGGYHTGHLWSLSVEEHFYLLWPLCLCLLLNRRSYLGKTACIALAFGIWRSIEFHFHFAHRIIPVLDGPMRTDLRLDGLIWGCCAGILFQNLHFRKTVYRLLRFPVFAAALALLIVSMVKPLPLSAIWQPITIPTLILGTAIHHDWAIGRVLEWPLLRWIGRISYSLYLWQQLFLVPSWEPHPLQSAQALPIDIILPFVCATVSYFCIERPAIRFGRKLSTKFMAQGAGVAQFPAVVATT